VRVYFDTGIFIDYLSTRGSANALLRSSERRGRSPADIATDAERLFKNVGKGHIGATSCLTYYEVEEALYRLLAQSAKGISRADMLLIPAARSITTQVQIVVELFNILVLDLTSGTVRLQLGNLICRHVEFAPPMRFTRQPQLHLMPTFSFRQTTQC
jgi:hypothetical protein